MSVIEKARELGLEISNSIELIQMRDTQNAMLANPEARTLVEEFNNKQKYYMSLRQQGLELSEDQKKDVEGLEQRMLDNPLIVDFFRSQQNFEKMLEEINQIISQSITGEAHSCSDECCSSCSGCEI